MRETPALRTLALGSIGVALAVLVLKLAAWRMTGSVALFSDAIESVVNVAAAILALVAIRVAEQPPDAGHPFGHHKAENFSAIAEGTLIVLAALLILREAWGALWDPGLEDADPVGLLVNALAMAINLAWARVLISAGRKHRSPALTANGRHLMADVWTSVGVLAGVGIAVATGWAILDPLLAILVALHVLREGWAVVFHSAGDLMDSAASSEDRSAIEDAVRASSQGALQIHDLRTRRAGKVRFIEFHLVVDRNMTVGEAHDICDTIEDAIADSLPGARTLIHLEPDGLLEDEGIHPLPAEDV